MLGGLPGKDRHQRPDSEMAQSDGGERIPASREEAIVWCCRSCFWSPRGISHPAESCRTSHGPRAAFPFVQQLFKSLDPRSGTSSNCPANFPRVVSRESERTWKRPKLAEKQFSMRSGPASPILRLSILEPRCFKDPPPTCNSYSNNV